ncbi:B12-binding domain-containing protein [soil metagenome]
MNPLQQTLGQAIEAQKADFAQAIVDEQWVRNPAFPVRYGEVGHAKCVQDVKYNLAYLAQAMIANSPALFATYIDWVKVLFNGLNIPNGELVESLEITRALLHQRFPSAVAIVSNFIDLGLQRLASAPESIPSFFAEADQLSALARQYLDSMLCGERSVGSRLILDAVAQGARIKDIYLHVFQPSQYEIGRLWQMNQITVAQEHYATAATQLIMSQLYAHIFNTARNGRRLIATGVGGELHEIGLRMVADFFEMEGWDTYYLGSNTPAATIVQTLLAHKADVLAISVTMTFHIQLVADLITQVRTVDPGRQIKIITGGYPFNIDPDLWQHVGADGYAANAEQAIATAYTLLGVQV